MSRAWLNVSSCHIDDREMHAWCRANRDRWVRESLRRRPTLDYSPDCRDIEIDSPYRFENEGELRIYIHGYMPDTGKGVISVTHDLSESTHLIAWRVALLVLRDARAKYLEHG